MPAGRTVSEGAATLREWVIAWAGRHQRRDWEQLCDDYLARIQPLQPVRQVVVKSSARQGRERLREEGRRLLQAIPEQSWIVALDRRGKSMDSRSFSRFLVDLGDRWPHTVAFLVGSDLGLSEEITEHARTRLSFGPMTFPHELARLMLCEQLYRALAIERGIKYHREPLRRP